MERSRREGKVEGKVEERSSMILTALQGGSTPEAIAKVMCIPIDKVNVIATE